MTIKQLLKAYVPRLCEKSSSPQLDIEILLSCVLKKEKSFLYAHPEYKLSNFQISNFLKLFQKRKRGLPIAYLIKHKEFYGLDFYVDKNVLIPCPETELLVEETLKQIKRFKNLKQINVADIGTGSGAIIISVAKTLLMAQCRDAINRVSTKKYRFFATETSKGALKVAKRNAKNHKLLKKIKFLQGNLLEPIIDKHIDIIVANLPYLDKNETNPLPSVDSIGLKFEPKVALYGGNDGFDIYRHFFKQIFLYNLKPGLILIEIGHKQAKLLRQTLKKYFKNAQCQIIKDLAGFDRVAVITYR